MKDGPAFALATFTMLIGCIMGATFGSYFPSESAATKISRSAVARERCAVRGGEYRNGACYEKAKEIFCP